MCYNLGMLQTVDLAEEIKRQLPPEMVDFMQTAGEVAASCGQRLYLVGGVVRDLLLRRPNCDLDLVVDRDAPDFAAKLGAAVAVKTVVHRRFKTAKVLRGGWTVDVATVRSEVYERPGALPEVRAGTLATDLFRRDFTINAMAIEMTAGCFGQLIDPYRGRDDLKDRLIRVLHDRSFTDDATRIWRAVRYEQRLGFRLEPGTRRLLIRDIPMLDTISHDRIRHELELVFKEQEPEKVLRRAAGLGVLAKLHPALRGDGWLVRKFREARRVSRDGAPLGLYLALLGYRLSDRQAQELADRLRLSRPLARSLNDTVNLRIRLETLKDPTPAPSATYELLKDFSPTAVLANRLAASSPAVRRRLKLYLDRLRHVRPALTGSDLLEMGILPGPRMKDILHLLLQARLDGKVKSRRGEVEIVKKVMA